MKRGYLFPILIAILAMAACEQMPGEETQMEAAVHANAMAGNCPAADESGNITIVPGLTATIITNGYGRVAISHDYADVHTTLWLYDEEVTGGRGTEIWTSGGAQPFQFQLGKGQVIKGWDLGVPCMRIGKTRELIIDPELAYGAAGKPPVPPNSRLVFNIEFSLLEAP